MRAFATYFLMAMVAIMNFGCLSTKRAYYFNWQTFQPRADESSTITKQFEINNIQPVEIEVGKENQIVASTSLGFQLPLRNKFGPMEHVSSEASLVDHQYVPSSHDQSIQKLSETEKQLKEANLKKNRFAKLGLFFSVFGLLMILIGIGMLSTVPFLLAFFLELIGLIFSVIGLKSEKRKSALVVVPGYLELFLVLPWLF